MIISKVTAFDLSNVDINQRELPPQSTFGTIQEGENIYLNFNPFSSLVNNKFFFFFSFACATIQTLPSSSKIIINGGCA